MATADAYNLCLDGFKVLHLRDKLFTHFSNYKSYEGVYYALIFKTTSARGCFVSITCAFNFRFQLFSNAGGGGDLKH